MRRVVASMVTAAAFMSAVVVWNSPTASGVQVRYYVQNEECGSDNDWDRMGPTQEAARVTTSVYVSQETPDGLQLIAVLEENFDGALNDYTQDTVGVTAATRLLQFVETRVGWEVGSTIGQRVLQMLSVYSVYSPYANIARGVAMGGGFVGAAAVIGLDAL